MKYLIIFIYIYDDKRVVVGTMDTKPTENDIEKYLGWYLARTGRMIVDMRDGVVDHVSPLDIGQVETSLYEVTGVLDDL